MWSISISDPLALFFYSRNAKHLNCSSPSVVTRHDITHSVYKQRILLTQFSQPEIFAIQFFLITFSRALRTCGQLPLRKRSLSLSLAVHQIQNREWSVSSEREIHQQTLTNKRSCALQFQTAFVVRTLTCLGSWTQVHTHTHRLQNTISVGQAIQR
jgi:hypothetical protein